MTNTNFPNGVTNQALSATTGAMGFPDPSAFHTWFDDFDDYVAAEWTITETGVGTRAVGNLDGGILVVTNAAADNDANFLQWSGSTNAATVETFKFETERELWFKARFKISDATQSDLFMGLYVTDTDPVGGIVDGVYFTKADGSTTLSLVVVKNSTATTTTAATLANDTYVTVGYHYDGASKIEIFVNDVRVANSVTTNLPDDEELTVSFGIQNGEAVAKILSLDYLLVSKARS